MGGSSAQCAVCGEAAGSNPENCYLHLAQARAEAHLPLEKAAAAHLLIVCCHASYNVCH